MDSQCSTVHLLMMTSSWVICLSVKSCDLDWFGSRCQYKCHCVNNNCSARGDCLGGSKCAPKWFGQGCQYQDLLTLPTANVRLSPKQRSHSWLTDNDGRTCNSNPDLTSISVQWTTQYIFTWLQFQIKDNAEVSEVEIKFKGPNDSTTMECRNKELLNLTSRLFEIRCDVQDAITEMTLGIKNVLKLCSLHVNGGRNVALKQATTQSEVEDFSNFTVDLAVDGNYSAKVAQQSQQFCTVKPTWTLTLDTNYLVTRFVIYSSQDELGTSLLGFILQAFDANQELVLHHLDNRSATSFVVDIINLAWKTPFRYISIMGKDLDSIENKSNLTLCEVEIYAECVPGSGGLDCENCSFRCSQSACERDGLCTQGCAGFRDSPKCITPCLPGTWGMNCKGLCKSDYCINNICDKDTGLCQEGCDERSDFPICSIACSNGNFGPNCSLNCEHCEQKLCDRSTTFCELSCHGYSNPPVCTKECNKNNWGPNCLRNCSFNCKHRSCDKHNGKCDLGCMPGYSSDDCTKAIEGYNENTSEVAATLALICLLAAMILAILFVLSCKKRKNGVTIFTGRPILVKDLNDFIKDHSQSYFETEFQEISSPEDVTFEAARRKENREKNSDIDIVPYDHSRVILKFNEEKNEGDYYNASFTKGFQNNGKYIAAQAPNSAMVNDFVRMLWEQKTEVVVMLTKLIENNVVMSEKYWPDDDPQTFGSVDVSLISEENFNDFTIRTLELTKNNESRTITQYQFTAWPLVGVPDQPWALVEFEQRVSLHSTEKSIVVHCWSGVGRTGLFIALHNARREAEVKGQIDFFTLITDLREDRVIILETAEQYWFLHRATQVAILSNGRTLTAANITEKMMAFRDLELNEEFKDACTMADIFGIKDKDTLEEVAFIETFKKNPPHILCPLPHKETVLKFWLMVKEYRVSLVIAIQDDTSATESALCNYLPLSEEEPLVLDNVHIYSSGTNSNQWWEKQKIIADFLPDVTRSLAHLKACFSDDDPYMLCRFVNHARTAPVLPNESTIFMCRNGSLLSGLACVLSLLLDRWDQGAFVSVPLVVGLVKSMKPAVIPTLSQYKALYATLQLYHQTKTDSNQ